MQCAPDGRLETFFETWQRNVREFYVRYTLLLT